MQSNQSGFWKFGFVALLVTCAWLLGDRHGAGTTAEAQSVPAGKSAGGGTADSNNDMVAVTGTASTGAAVLYLVDTRQKRLCVYQASGKNIELVAARNIEFDLRLDGYRDETEAAFQVDRLRAAWLQSQGAKPGGGAPK
jgi:hypothetical protein